MDGFQSKLTSSLRFRLSLWLSLAIILVAVAAGSLSFFTAFKEAKVLQDDQLRQVAALVDEHGLPVQPPDLSREDKEADPDLKLIIQTLGDSGAGTGGEKIALPAKLLHDGIQTIVLNGERWRVFVRTLRSGERLAVAQQSEIRDQIATDSSYRTVLPLVVLIPILTALISIMVGGMLKPITRLSHEVDSRAEQDLRPLAAHQIPDEIRPFVASINRLLERVAQAMDLQRRFVADAAHELRSPLTALSLQAQNVMATELSNETQARLIPLQQGIDRAKNLLEQLLAFARSQALMKSAVAPILLLPIIRELFEEIAAQAEAKNIDLGAKVDEGLSLLAHDLDIRTLLRNLLDNAVRYTPQGGVVDLSAYLHAGFLCIEIADSGPGISDVEKIHVFEPFHRLLGQEAEGTGLGLAIVKNTIARLQGQIELLDAMQGTGLIVKVSLPLS
ncbi:ATP-binding protein [Deefgea piscis]|uniref:ATP-binding protein n=1 Tax=Deefgea piscis TaxID=2739061 RepID=UPI001C801FED|nr:ATP-binding protein [Deefgea piscis]QZA80960.1 two-component sensor histidine kinase [Deefgea piscis]